MSTDLAADDAIDWGDDLPPTTAEKGYAGDWPRVRAWVLARHIEKFGYVCPGYMREPHESHDLDGHHIVPLSEGGESVPGNVKILCGTCHGRLHAFRRHPRKRCPAGHLCMRLPTGSPTCCGHHGDRLGE